jgi:mannose-6-phosphate isomerase-like protein (cupin superfamily)
VESYYIIRGELTIFLGNEVLKLVQDEAASIDSSKPHKVTNTGSATNKYAVIIGRPDMRRDAPAAL